MTATAEDAGEKAAAFRELHRTSYADVVRFIERRGFDHESEDIAATAFTTAWRRFDERPADPRPWVFGIARNAMENSTRGRYRKKALEVRVQSELQILTYTSTESVDTRLDVARAWATLAAADQEVLSLVAFEGLSPDDAASVLDLKRTTYAMRLARARKRLRAAIDSQSSRHLDEETKRNK